MTDYLALIREIRRSEYFLLYKGGYGASYADLAACRDAYNALVRADSLAVRMAERQIAAEHARKKTLNKRVRKILGFQQPCFLTLTFNDASLELSHDTRHTYVRRFLKDHFYSYVSNIDFGSLNGRPHYHAIASAPKKSLGNSWVGGRLDVQPITFNLDKPTVLSSYVNTLVNHSTKVSVGDYRMIYSRGEVPERFILNNSFDYVHCDIPEEFLEISFDNPMQLDLFCNQQT